MDITAARPRKRYYGWWIAGELAITQTISYGIVYYAFSVFITPMEAEMGWSRAAITGAFSAAFLVSGLMAIPVGFWVDRNGARLLMTVGVALASLLVFAWANVQSLPALYAVWICMGITMAGIFYDPAFAVIAQWFNRRRGLALTMVTFAAGFASTIFIPLANWLLQRSDWRTAASVLALFLGLTVVPLHALILRRRPQDLGLLPDGVDITHAPGKPAATKSMSLRDALRQPSFWWLTVAFAFTTLSAIAVRVHLIPLLLDRGFDANFAAAAAGAVGAMQVLGRVLFAPTEARLPRQVMTGAIFALHTVALIIVLFVQTTAGVWLFVILLGMAHGAATLARPALLADFYGTAYYGRISSVMVVFLTLAITIAPVGAGWIYTLNNSYDPVLWVLVGLSCVPLVALVFVRRE